MPDRQPPARLGAVSSGPETLLAAVPPGFQTAVVRFSSQPFRRVTYAYPSRPPATC